MQKRTHLQTRRFVHTLNVNCKTFICHMVAVRKFSDIPWRLLKLYLYLSLSGCIRWYRQGPRTRLSYKTPKSSVRQFANSLCVCFQWFIPKGNRATYKNESKLFPIMLIGFKVFHPSPHSPDLTTPTIMYRVC